MRDLPDASGVWVSGHEVPRDIPIGTAGGHQFEIETFVCPHLKHDFDAVMFRPFVRSRYFFNPG